MTVEQRFERDLDVIASYAETLRGLYAKGLVRPAVAEDGSIGVTLTDLGTALAQAQSDSSDRMD